MVEPRIGPGARRETGIVNFVIARVLGAATGTGPPNLFTTIGRHRKLLRPWLRFAAALMPRGALPRQDSELVILRVADNYRCEYERRHHVRLAALSGLSDAQIAAVPAGADGHLWSQRQAALLRATDELHADRRISDDLWAELRAVLSETELIELPMLVGHYEMVAMTVNALGIVPDPEPGPPSPLSRALHAVAGTGRKSA